jgi:hypothetical protein
MEEEERIKRFCRAYSSAMLHLDAAIYASDWFDARSESAPGARERLRIIPGNGEGEGSETLRAR